MSEYNRIEREAAAELLSACACECATTGWFIFMHPVSAVLFRDLVVTTRAMIMELAGLAWRHTQVEINDLNAAELYAESEALVRSGWEPSDDD